MGGYELNIAMDIFRGRYREGFETAKPDRAEYAADLQVRPADDEPRVPARAPDHGASAVKLVSALRSQPANFRAEYFLRKTGGLREGNATRLPRAGCSQLHRSASGSRALNTEKAARRGASRGRARFSKQRKAGSLRGPQSASNFQRTGSQGCCSRRAGDFFLRGGLCHPKDLGRKPKSTGGITHDESTSEDFTRCARSRAVPALRSAAARSTRQTSPLLPRTRRSPHGARFAGASRWRSATCRRESRN